MTGLGPSAGDDETQRILGERARSLAEVIEGQRAATAPHLVLRVGDHRLLLPAARARHVVTAGTVAAVPGVAEAIRGTTPVMGEVVPVVELGALVGAGSDRPPAERQLVVVDDGDHPLALEVDGVEDLVDLEIDQSASGSQSSPGELTRPLSNGLRLLALDAALTHPRLAPTDSPPAKISGGEP